MAFSGEVKTSKAFLKGISDMTFDSRSFAHLLADDHPMLQAKTMEVFLEFVNVMARKIETDNLSGPNADAIVTAARIRDALEVYNT